MMLKFISPCYEVDPATVGQYYRAAVGGLPHNQEYITGRVSYIGQYFFNVQVKAGYQESILMADILIGNVVIV